MKKSVLIILLAVFPVLLFSENMAFPFYREAFDGKTTDKMSGVLYYKDSPKKEEKGIYFYVTSPVKQIITYKSEETHIYYPEEKKAFILTEEKSAANINPFEGANKKIDLKDFGMVVVKKEKDKNGTKEIWAPKDAAAVPIKSIVMLRDKSDRLKKMEMTQKDGKIMMRIIYDNYIMIKDKKFPLYIETYSAADKNAYQEKIILSTPDLKAKLPEIIKNFVIPADVTVKKVKM